MKNKVKYLTGAELEKALSRVRISDKLIEELHGLQTGGYDKDVVLNDSDFDNICLKSMLKKTNRIRDFIIQNAEDRHYANKTLVELLLEVKELKRSLKCFRA